LGRRVVKVAGRKPGDQCAGRGVRTVAGRSPLRCRRQRRGRGNSAPEVIAGATLDLAG
jgi:hypothetical protein